MRSVALAAFATVSAACSQFPCVDEAGAHRVEPLSFEYSMPARYTYWFQDGAQRVVFGRDEVPSTARHAVLVHLPERTAPDLHGPVGWYADVSGDAPQAQLVPMATVRARAYAAWSGDWAARWMAVNAAVTVARQGLRDDPPPAPDPEPQSGFEKFHGELFDEGISLDEVKLQRAVRAIGAQRPAPRDFGISLDIHPAWLFVDAGCDACDAAEAWLDETGVRYHRLDIQDPSNAGALRAVSATAAVEPAVPSLWRGAWVTQGFSKDAYAR